MNSIEDGRITDNKKKYLWSLSGNEGFIFADTADCEVIHGALYACLRALFGLSVIGILVSLFSGMLVYQLLGYVSITRTELAISYSILLIPT